MPTDFQYMPLRDLRPVEVVTEVIQRVREAEKHEGERWYRQSLQTVMVHDFYRGRPESGKGTA